MTFKIPFIKLIKSIKAVDLVIFFSYSVILLTFDYSNNNKFTNVSIQYLLWKQLNPVSIIILNTFFSHFQRTFKKTTGTLKNGLRYILYTECIPTPAWSVERCYTYVSIGGDAAVCSVDFIDGLEVRGRGPWARGRSGFPLFSSRLFSRQLIDTV